MSEHIFLLFFSGEDFFIDFLILYLTAGLQLCRLCNVNDEFDKAQKEAVTVYF
jgi:hypothetical protein